MERTMTIVFLITAIVSCFIGAMFTISVAKKGIPSPGESDSIERHQPTALESGETKERGASGGLIQISEETIKEEGIKVNIAAPGKLRLSTNFPGEIVVNPDRMAHITPRMGGIVIEVRKNLGDKVSAGDVMAVLESKELAVAKANYLATMKRLELATSNFVRFESLWQKAAVPEKQYLEIKTAREEGEIEKNSAEQILRALGFSENLLQRLPKEPAYSLSRYEITAPFDGTVIQKHITLGEMLKDDAAAFVVADLSSVWANVYVHPRELPNISNGQEAVIATGNGVPNVQGRVEYVEPIVGDNTRSAIARVVLDNPDGKLRPGLFVTAKIYLQDIDVAVAIPKTALKNFENKTITFIRKEGGFEPNIVKTGRADNSRVEIVSGLKAGELFASEGSFILKAEAGKNDASDEH